MSGYRKQPDKINNPGQLLSTLRTCREAMTRASADVKPFGTIYHGLAMVIGAIDALAVFLTHQRDYFAASGSTMPDGEGEIDAQKFAREKGKASWPD
jgi:hypothetical protein